MLYWFHENDTPEKRRTLKVHPRRNLGNPLTGVFATHSPMRPNLIAMTRCRLIAVDGLTLTVDAIDARPGSPVIDIKSFFPPDLDGEEALAQVSCILIALSFPELRGKRPAFTGIEEAKFRKPVRPGDRLELTAELRKMRRGFAVLGARAEVNGELSAEAVIKASMV